MTTLSLTSVSTRTNFKSLKYFIIFSVYSAPTLIFNISFYFFLILFRDLNRKLKVSFLKRDLSHLFAFAFFIGLFLNLYNSVDRDNSLLVAPNYFYWVVIIFVVSSTFYFFDQRSISKYVLYGLIFLILSFYLRKFLSAFGLNFLATNSQNGFAFALIIFSPISYNYIKRNTRNTGKVWISFAILVLAALFSGSRSAAFLVFVVLIVTHFIDRISIRTIFLSTIIGGFLYLIISFDLTKTLINEINPRVYDLLYDTETVLKNDRSYLIRLAMIEKGLVIYEKYPYYGVGLNNFSSFLVQIPGDFAGAEYVINKDIFTDISSHNSYINLLAEGGLVLFIPFVLLLSYILLYGIFWFNKYSYAEKALFIGFLGMISHFYFINSVVNSFTWTFIGLNLGIVLLHKRRRTVN